MNVQLVINVAKVEVSLIRGSNQHISTLSIPGFSPLCSRQWLLGIAGQGVKDMHRFVSVFVFWKTNIFFCCWSIEAEDDFQCRLAHLPDLVQVKLPLCEWNQPSVPGPLSVTNHCATHLSHIKSCKR